MKKLIAIALVIVSLCNVFPAFAAKRPIPHISNFATMTTKKINEFYHEITITSNLYKIDRIFVNWMGLGEEPEELGLTEDGRATFFTTGHKYQPGVHWTNDYDKVVVNRITLWYGLPDTAIGRMTAIFISRNPGYCIEQKDPDKKAKMNGYVQAWYQMFKAATASNADIAFYTLQDDYLVCYNRKGQIVKICDNDGSIIQ